MSVHTPGPWVARQSWIFAADGRMVGFATELGPDGSTTQTRLEEFANARLIAAAPTMHDDLALISRVVRRFLTPEQCAALIAAEEAALGRAEDIAEGRQ